MGRECKADKISPRIDVHVESPIKEDFQAFIDQYKANQECQNAANNKLFWLTLVSTIVLAIYAGFTVALFFLSRTQVQTAQDTYRVSQRPYIGGTGIVVTHVWHDAAKQPHPSSVWTDQTTEMTFTGGAKNYGPLPGRDSAVTWRIFHDGQEEPLHGVPDTPTTVYPGQQVGLIGRVFGDDYQRIIHGTETLDIELSVSYDGPIEHYFECQRYEYHNSIDGFINLGSCKH